ncbi:hypothetical protein QQX98_003545 [Neonectria punicea]|uniref:Major facilitator superfamily (MFS) profile domain-containing protein n=1 Tax=Neonectria punicea TaxID=979145 RepID=A0ABR1HE09_9HYPO
MDSIMLPPGTQRIEDANGAQIVLAPQPGSDPNQPLNWSTGRKTLHMTLLSLYAMMVFAILCVSVPLWQDFNEELGMSYDQLNNGYATNMATLAVGCIIFIPIALRIGRRPVYIVTGLIMLASAIWQAKMQTVGDMIATNAISGIAGAVNEALFQVTNYLGPVAAGHVAIAMGWRWVFWLCSIFMATICLLMVFFLEESKYIAPPLTGLEVPNIHQHDDFNKADNGTNQPQLSTSASHKADTVTSQSRRVVDIDPTIPMKTYWERHAFWSLDNQAATQHISVWKQVYQPFQILVTFPAVMFAALQYGFAIAMLAILAVTQSSIYAAPPYNFGTAGIGNMNLPPAIGALLGSAFGGPLVDYLIVQVAKRRGGIYEPETRLWLFLVPGLSMTVGCLMYGLTIAQGMPWIINAVGAGFIGFAIGGTGDMALTYVQDSYQLILGSALTAVVFVRNIIATALVFAVTPWMTNMGVYDMFVLLGCIAAAIALTCVPLIIWGRGYRVQLADKYRHFAAQQY